MSAPRLEVVKRTSVWAFTAFCGLALADALWAAGHDPSLQNRVYVAVAAGSALVAVVALVGWLRGPRGRALQLFEVALLAPVSYTHLDVYKRQLEEWAWDADILQTFATNEAGEPIPADLVRRMRRADDFGKGYLARTQMFYAALSYWFHTERPADLTARTRELQAQYSLFPYIEGTHFTLSLIHI